MLEFEKKLSELAAEYRSALLFLAPSQKAFGIQESIAPLLKEYDAFTIPPYTATLEMDKARALAVIERTKELIDELQKCPRIDGAQVEKELQSLPEEELSR